MVEGGMTCIKYLLFSFNLLFFIIGLLLIILGAVVQTSFGDYFDVVGGVFSGAAILLIVVGLIIFAIGFFGCCGAWKENYCMVQTFVALLVIIFILEIAAGIAGFALQRFVRDVVKQGLEQSLKEYENSTSVQESWDDIQRGLKCCGVVNYKDWQGKLGHLQQYPKSCCADEEQVSCGTNPKLAYQEGCLNKMDDAIKVNLQWIAVVGVIVALIQIVGIVFACCLGRAIRKEYDVV